MTYVQKRSEMEFVFIWKAVNILLLVFTFTRFIMYVDLFCSYHNHHKMQVDTLLKFLIGALIVIFTCKVGTYRKVYFYVIF